MNLTEIKTEAETMSTEDYGRLAAQRDWLIERVEELAETVEHVLENGLVGKQSRARLSAALARLKDE